MGLTNAEKQAAYRARYAVNKQRVAELEAEVERLKAKQPASDDRPGGLLHDDITSKRWAEWFEAQIVEGRAAPSAVYLLGSNLQFIATVYWSRDGKRGPRKLKTYAEQQAIWQRKKQRKAG